MKNKRFLTYFIATTAIMMIAFIIYIFSLNRTYKVVNYELSKGYSYTGEMKKNKFSGSGILKTPDGSYKGSFVDGRFDGRGIFVGDDYSYLADFDHKSINKNIVIKIDSGDIYRKIDGNWELLNNEN